MISYKASVAQICVLFRLNDFKWSLTKPRSPKNVSYWDSMISYKSSVAQICVLFRFNDRQWSPTKPWSLKSVPFFRLYDWSMISYKASVAQICVLSRFNDRQWSLTNPRLPNKCFYLVSMIVNDLLQSLCRPNMFFFICCLWSSMISYKASVSQICVLFRLNDYKWSLTNPRSPKYVSFIDSMIVNVMISYKASVAQICVLFRFNDRQWSLTNPRSPNKCFYLVSMIVNDLLQNLGRTNMCLI